MQLDDEHHPRNHRENTHAPGMGTRPTLTSRRIFGIVLMILRLKRHGQILNKVYGAVR